MSLDGALAMALAAVLVGGIARGFTGFGSALIIVPALVIAYGPAQAVIVMSIIEVPGVMQLLPTAIRQADWRAMAPLFVAAALTVPMGAALLAFLDPEVMRRCIAAMVVGFGLLIASGWRYRGRVTAVHSAAVGAIGGLGSGAANLGGPPVVMFLLAKGSDAARTRAGIMAYFSIAMVLRLAAYAWLDLLTLSALKLALILAPLYILAIWIGSRFFKGASETTFRRVVVTLVLTMGAVALVK